MPEKKEVKQASDYLTKHFGPWQKALGTPSNELRVALHRAVQQGTLSPGAVKQIIEHVQAIKKADPSAKIGHVVKSAEDDIRTVGAPHALARLRLSLGTMRNEITRLKSSEDLYQKLGIGKHSEWLRTPDNIAFHAFAAAHSLRQVRSEDLKELGELIAKLNTGSEEEKRHNRDRFYRRLLDAEDLLREGSESDARRAFVSLLHWTRGIAGELEEQWFGVSEAPEEVGERRRVSEHTVMFDLDAMRRQAEAASEVERAPVMDVDELEKKLRRGVAIQKIIAKPLRFTSAAWNRVKQMLSKKKNVVVHDENSGVSSKHVELTFLPKNNTVRVFDLHRRRDEPGTIIRPGSRLSVPVLLERGRQRQGVSHSFPSKDASHLLLGASAQLAEGHVFQVGANAFRIAKIRENQVALRGVDGPVAGRLFKFDPRKEKNIVIGSHPDAHIKLIPLFHEA